LGQCLHLVSELEGNTGLAVVQGAFVVLGGHIGDDAAQPHQPGAAARRLIRQGEHVFHPGQHGIGALGGERGRQSEAYQRGRPPDGEEKRTRPKEQARPPCARRVVKNHGLHPARVEKMLSTPADAHCVGHS